MNKNILFLLSLILVLSSCDDLFDPAIDNNRPLTDIYDEPGFAHGLLVNGYTRIPTNGWNYSDMATDNAVANDQSNAFYAISTGQWASNNNPVSQWQNSKAAIQYMNLMLREVDSVKFSDNAVVNLMFQDRIKGEAYGLRALFMYYLLQAHGGMSGGSLLGVPIILEPEDIESDFNQPRATFEECMQQLYSDAQKAIVALPTSYASVGDESQIKAKYLDEGAGINDYNRVFGDDARQLMSGLIVRAVRAQAALMAASPAFSEGSTTTWEDAANYAAEVIDLNGGVGGLADEGVTWYTQSSGNDINGVGAGVNPPEILWRTDIGTSTNLEEDNFPPSLFGRGLINPTQNLVDAFPMATGYPITDPSSDYDASNPYSDRDPRLQQFVVVNGSTGGSGNSTILTEVAIGNENGLNQSENATRTGYYLRKLLRQDVNLASGTVTAQNHINPRIRYTEIYLIYAEAANEAFGPMGAGSNGYSAYDVISAIRERAGVGLNNGDAYLQSINSDENAMRDLIRNERRLELSFEGFRFWDLRRWDADLTETAQGILIQNGTQEIINVDNRIFDDYMIYGPVPYSEILKFGSLEQNSGW